MTLHRPPAIAVPPKAMTTNHGKMRRNNGEAGRKVVISVDDTDTVAATWYMYVCGTYSVLEQRRRQKKHRRIKPRLAARVSVYGVVLSPEPQNLVTSLLFLDLFTGSE